MLKVSGSTRQLMVYQAKFTVAENHTEIINQFASNVCYQL